MPKAKSAKPLSEQKDTKSKALDELIKDIQSRYGDGAIMKLGEVGRVDVDAIPTGSVSLDIALGVGGVPQGRIIEVFGPESSGKTARPGCRPARRPACLGRWRENG